MIDVAKLHTQLLAAGMPVAGVSTQQAKFPPAPTSTYYTRAEGLVRVDWQSAPTAAQDGQANGLIAAHDGMPTVNDELRGTQISPKLLAAVVIALSALPASAKMSWPTWVANTITAANAKITAVLAGRMPDGTL